MANLQFFFQIYPIFTWLHWRYKLNKIKKKILRDAIAAEILNKIRPVSQVQKCRKNENAEQLATC